MINLLWGFMLWEFMYGGSSLFPQYGSNKIDHRLSDLEWEMIKWAQKNGKNPLDYIYMPRSLFG